MSNKPEYFEKIRRKASDRWDQLEKDPELAGPWHQLFRQVQSPRHNGARFPWEHRTSGGDLVRYYWPKDHCLEREPLEIEADVWSLVEQHPGTYAFILASVVDAIVEIKGDDLLKETGQIKLYPASYRLVYTPE